ARRRLVSSEAIGVLHHQLLEAWFSSLSGEGWYTKDSQFDDTVWWEEATRAPWVEIYLNQLRDTSLRLIQGEPIDPLLDAVEVKNDLERLPPCGASSEALRKWSRSFRLYDRMSRILPHPLPKLLTSAGSASELRRRLLNLSA
ncbi:hypothetical protein GOP47_0030849, partial [Adiantum capillus-veneris]